MNIQTSKVSGYSDYRGVPDKVVKRKENLTKGSEVKFNVISSKWIDFPIYKDLSELDSGDLVGYNEVGFIYVYNPKHVDSDKMGILKFRLLGVTRKKSDKRVLLIVEDMCPKATFKTVYLEVEGDNVIDCGRVFNTTFSNWKDCEVGVEYKGYRNSKWIKLDLEDYLNLTGKVYNEIKVV